MRETQPQVELIARPSLDLAALERFLKHVGGESWLQMRTADGQEVNAGQTLIEAAGRACYRSWQEGLNPNVTRIRKDQQQYFTNLLNSGHGSVLEHANYSFILGDVSRVFCYDEDTEVLTDEGWIPWPKIQGDEIFATLNPVTDHIEYQRATEHFAAMYEGPMYRLKSEQVDLLVTPNHRMWVQKHDTQAARRHEEPYRIYFAGDIAGKRVKYQKTGTWVGTDPEFIEIPASRRAIRSRSGQVRDREYPARHVRTEAFARFLGYFLAEGSLTENRLCLSQNEGTVLNKMTETLRELGLTPRVLKGKQTGGVRASDAALVDFLAQLGGTACTKRIPPFVQDWSPRLIRLFLEAMVEGDGSRRGSDGHAVIYTTSPEMADDLQILAIKAGWSANLRVDDRTGLRREMKSGQVFFNQRPCFVVSLVTKRTRPLVNHNRQGLEKHDSWVPYRGGIYCVKVPNGLLFVRRNGKPVVSANTHELVRHRAGSAFSQESLRFVRLDEIPFRIPEVMEPLRDKIVNIVETLEEFQISAAEHFDLDGEGLPFHVKKEVTSAMRRLAPEGVSTVIFWTANVRTLRHTIQMRTHPSAEEELRTVFNRIGEIMVEEAPLLFGDFVVEDGAWTTEYRKV